MFKRLQSFLQNQKYYPGLLGLFTNPFYFARKGLLENIAPLANNLTGKILDIGCGQKPYEKLFKASHYIGLEIDSPENRRQKKADFFYDGTIFPFQDEEFDSIVMNEVFEHVFNPNNFLDEVNRVLKRGGMLLMSVPFVWDEHEQPHDYARYSSFGLRFILEGKGFQIIELKKSVNDVRVVFQLWNSYVYKKTVTSNRYINVIMTCIFMAPSNVLGALLSNVLPRNNDLYLDNVVLAQKIK